MTPDQIRAMEVPSNSIMALLLKELVAQVAEFSGYLAVVTAAPGVVVQVASAAAGGLSVVVEPAQNSQPS